MRKENNDGEVMKNTKVSGIKECVRVKHATTHTKESQHTNADKTAARESSRIPLTFTQIE